MVQYKTIITKDGYEILTQPGGDSVALILSPPSGSIELNNIQVGQNSYAIKAKSVWQTSFILYKNDNQEVGEISFNWKGETIIRLENRLGICKYFVLKINMWTNLEGVLYDFLTHPIWKIMPVVNQDMINSDFEISCEKGYFEHENDVEEIELLLCTVYPFLFHFFSRKPANT
jgi:hypothetical protein